MATRGTGNYSALSREDEEALRQYRAMQARGQIPDTRRRRRYRKRRHDDRPRESTEVRAVNHRRRQQRAHQPITKAVVQDMLRTQKEQIQEDMKTETEFKDDFIRRLQFLQMKIEKEEEMREKVMTQEIRERRRNFKELEDKLEAKPLQIVVRSDKPPIDQKKEEEIPTALPSCINPTAPQEERDLLNLKMNLNHAAEPRKWLKEVNKKKADFALNKDLQDVLKELQQMNQKMPTKLEIIRTHRALMRRLKYDLIWATDHVIPEVQRDTVSAWYAIVRPDEVQRWHNRINTMIHQLKESVHLAEEVQQTVQFSLERVKQTCAETRERRRMQTMRVDEEKKETLTLKGIAEWLHQTQNKGSTQSGDSGMPDSTSPDLPTHHPKEPQGSQEVQAVQVQKDHPRQVKKTRAEVIDEHLKLAQAKKQKEETARTQSSEEDSTSDDGSDAEAK